MRPLMTMIYEKCESSGLILDKHFSGLGCQVAARHNVYNVRAFVCPLILKLSIIALALMYLKARLSLRRRGILGQPII